MLQSKRKIWRYLDLSLIPWNPSKREGACGKTLPREDFNFKGPLYNMQSQLTNELGQPASGELAFKGELHDQCARVGLGRGGVSKQ